MKNLIAVLLVVVGSNVFTFATTRYWTTKHVLTRAQARMETVLRKEGLFETVYRSEMRQSVGPRLAISQAGGMHYWWNNGVVYWEAGALLIIIGFLVPFVKSRHPNNDPVAHS